MKGYDPRDWVDAWRPTGATRPNTPTVDVHSHLMVPESAEMALPYRRPEDEPRTFFSSAVTKEVNNEFYRLAADKYTDPETRLADMDALGIDVQLVSLTPFHYFYWAEAGLASRLAGLQNQRISEVVSHDPGRFVGVGTLPMGHPDLALSEARRLVDLGFPAVEIGTDVNGDDLDHPRFEPVWSALEELGLVVILHPAGFTEARRLTDYYLVNVVGMPLSTTVSVTRLILAGVFERHPGLKLLLVHGGGYLAFYSARTDHAFGHRPELRQHIDRLPSEYLADMYFDITVFDPSMVEELVTRFGPDRVMLGTDYPFDMGLTDPLSLIGAARLSQTEREMIAGENAARLFGIRR